MPQTIDWSRELASLDGRLVTADQATIPATDEGLLRGDGVFEVVRVYRGRPFALADHLVRLEHSARNLRLGVPIDRPGLERRIAELLERRDPAGFDGALRIVVTRGGHEIVLTEPIEQHPPSIRLALVVYAPTRILDGVKSLSYAANMLAGRIARERGFDEALLVTPHGRILEAPTASFFWVDEQGLLCTPPLDDHILASITRDRLLRLFEVSERHCTRADLATAREAFLASTTREVQPVACVEEQRFAAPGPITREAQAKLTRLIADELAA